MKSFTFLPRVILGLLLFVTGGGISLAADVTNTVNGTTYTFKVGTNNTVTLSKIGDTDLKSYTGTDIDLLSAYPNGTFTVDGTTYTITSMDAMGGNKNLQTVKMPSTVTSLPKYCFSGCTALTTVSFPGIQTIGNYAFQDCSALTGITIPEGATVGERAFMNSGLTGELTIPKGTYDNRAFENCNKVTALVIYTGSKISNPWNSYGCFGSMSSVTTVTIKDDIKDGDHTIPAHFFGNASFSKDGVTLTIPESIKTIGDGAFYHANFPTNALDLSQFTSIGSSAFEGDNKITVNNGVTFAENTTIGEQAFCGCTALSGELTIPKGARVGHKAFNDCSGITSIVLHTGMTSVKYYWNDEGCFMSMPGVKSVSIIKDDGYNTIPAYVFGGAKFADGVTLTIPSTITGIGDYAFNHANFPTTLDLSSQFTSYGISAFEGNGAFKGNENGVIAVKTPSGKSGVTVGSRAFWNTGATEIDIYPNMVYSGCAPTSAYYDNGAGPYNGTNIKTIKFTDGVTSVPDYVFLNASDIPSTCTVTWPTKPITHIGNGAFCGVQFTAALPKEMSGDGTIGEYAYAHNKMSGAITIPDGCKEIGSNALHDCKNITKITVPKSTTSIGEFAFSGCATLASVELPTLTSCDPQLTLGGGFIANDPKLTAFTITNAVDTIYCCSNGDRNNASFSSLTSPFTVTLASDKVKAETENRVGGTFFTFEKDGTTENPNTLTIQVANGVTSIPDELFSESTSGILRQSFIDKIVLSGNDVKSIGKESFNHIRTLLSVDMSGAPNIASIGESAFADCAKLTTVTFGESSNITTVGASAFSGCSALTSVDFGGAKKLQTLGECAFNNCTSLAKINQTSDGKNDLRGSTLTSIGQYTFGGCTSLANLYLPSTLMRISSDAFKDALAANNSAVYVQAIANNKFTTYSRGFGLTPTSASVWTISSIDKANKKVILTQASTMPSGDDYPNGYVFYNSGSQQSYDFPVIFNGTTVSKATSYGTSMKGTLDGKTFTDDESKYCYFVWSKDMKLHPVLAKSTLPAGKAYFEGEKTESAKAYQGFAFVLDYNGTTDIKGVKEEQHNELGNDYYYDLGGRKVENPSEGIYIHHGKKVIVTKSL